MVASVPIYLISAGTLVKPNAG